MKATIYLRVAKQSGTRHPVKVAANVKPSHEPLYRGETPLPTAAFAVEFDLPDAMFRRAGQVLAEVKVDGRKAVIAAEVKKLDEAE